MRVTISGDKSNLSMTAQIEKIVINKTAVRTQKMDEITLRGGDSFSLPYLGISFNIGNNFRVKVNYGDSTLLIPYLKNTEITVIMKEGNDLSPTFRIKSVNVRVKGGEESYILSAGKRPGVTHFQMRRPVEYKKIRIKPNGGNKKIVEITSWIIYYLPINKALEMLLQDLKNGEIKLPRGGTQVVWFEKVQSQPEQWAITK